MIDHCAECGSDPCVCAEQNRNATLDALRVINKLDDTQIDLLVDAACALRKMKDELAGARSSLEAAEELCYTLGDRLQKACGAGSQSDWDWEIPPPDDRPHDNWTETPVNPAAMKKALKRLHELTRQHTDVVDQMSLLGEEAIEE
jgi:hypothetical protein